MNKKLLLFIACLIYVGILLQFFNASILSLLSINKIVEMIEGLQINNEQLFGILHDQWQRVNSLIDSQFNILRYLGNDPFENICFINENYDDNDIRIILLPPSKYLEHALMKFIEIHELELETRYIPLLNWEKIGDLSKNLSYLNSQKVNKPFRYRELASKLLSEIEFLRELEPIPKFHKSNLRDVIDKAREVERLACIYDLHRSIEMIKITNDELFDFIQTFNGNSVKKENINEIVEIAQIVEQIDKKYQNTSSLNGLETRITNKSEGAKVKASKLQLTKAIENLFENAVKYTGKLPPDSEYENTWIKILIEKNEDFVSISFESWGVPITEDEVELIFKPSYRGFYAKHLNIKGTGTGLSFSKEFAIKCGGNVSVETVPMKKNVKHISNTTTTFTITLPITY